MHDSEYSQVDPVTTPGDTQTAGHHVVDYELQKLLSQGWQRYNARVREGLDDLPVAAVKEITTTFQAECQGGDQLMRGVRAVSRTRRTWVMEEALWQVETGEVVATSRVVMVGIDRSTGKAAEVPAAMWQAVEALEGREIPISERVSA